MIGKMQNSFFLPCRVPPADTVPAQWKAKDTVPTLRDIKDFRIASF